MNDDPERWRRVQDLCHAALERDAPHRDGFLAAACAGDDELRREVESLLVHAGGVDAFLDASTMQGVAHAIVLDSRSSLIGCQVGAYEVVAHIGAGGMGEVYRARDTKLQRDVALKVLPDVFVNDPDRLARFQREALVLASLNHPHIAAIYGLEESNDVRALVLELVEGPTLADRIAQGPIPLDEACSIATQIAAALEAAHRLGIVHRDLKPANVKIRPDGTVKVLDFGLAKATERGGRIQSGAPTPSVQTHGRRRHPGHNQLHGARAGSWPRCRQSRRHLGVRLRVVGNADGRTGFRRRDRVGHDLRDPDRCNRRGNAFLPAHPPVFADCCVDVSRRIPAGVSMTLPMPASRSTTQCRASEMSLTLRSVKPRSPATSSSSA